MRLIITILLNLLPVAAFASEGHDYSVKGFIWRIFIFAIFVGILNKLLRKKIISALDSGIKYTVESIEHAKDAYDKASEKLKSYEDSSVDIQKQLEDMRRKAEASIEQEMKNILIDAESNAKKIISNAEISIDTETTKATTELKKEFVTLALIKAETLLSDKIDDGKQNEYVLKRIAEIGV